MIKFLSGLQRTGNSKRSKSCRPRLEWMEPRSLLSAITWTGGAGDNNWDSVANWNPERVPTSTDDVTINTSANVVYSLANVTDSINSLTSTEPLTISAGGISIAAASTIGSLSISGGTLTGTGDVSVSGLVTLTAGTLSGSSSLNANGGILINLAGGRFNLDGRTVNNAAGFTATWNGSGISEIEASDGSVFNNLGTFVANSTGLYNETGTGAASSFNNPGSFSVTGTAAVEFSVPFNVPGGSVDIIDGDRLDLDQGGTSTGAAFNVDGLLGLVTPFAFDTATTISGAGTLQERGSDTQAFPGTYTFTGSIDIRSGTVQVDGSLANGMASSDFGGILSGTGTVGATMVGGLILSPGDNPDPGILNAQGDVVFAAHPTEVDEVGSTFSVVAGAPRGAEIQPAQRQRPGRSAMGEVRFHGLAWLHAGQRGAIHDHQEHRPDRWHVLQSS